MLKVDSAGRVSLKLIVTMGDFSDLQSREIIITIFSILFGKPCLHSQFSLEDAVAGEIRRLFQTFSPATFQF